MCNNENSIKKEEVNNVIGNINEFFVLELNKFMGLKFEIYSQVICKTFLSAVLI